MGLVGAFDFLDITTLEVREVVYLSLVLTVILTVVSLGIAWLWRRWRDPASKRAN